MDVPKFLHEQLYLLALDTGRQRSAAGWRLGHLLRAGMLAELLIQGHLDDAAGGPAAKTTAVADPLLAAVLHQIAESRRRSWQHWVGKRTGPAVREVRAKLAADGWIRAEPGRVLGILPVTRVTVRDTRVLKRLVGTATTALRPGQTVARLDPRDAGLAALAAVVKLRTVLPRAEWRAARGRGEELGTVVAPVPRALRKAIQAAEAAAAG